MAARTALITGANRGIGLAAARGLALAGLRVVLSAGGSTSSRSRSTSPTSGR